MARARNIKPSFFKNELLVELMAYDRLLFIGLWCLADREGRVEDRPKRIKMELFPCDTYDVDHGLAELQRCGFVMRYESKGVRVIEIINFLKHQTPHGTEKDSELPDQNGDLTVNERSENGYATGKKRKNNVKSPQNNSNPPLDNSSATVTALGENTLNPESGFLNPDLLNPDGGEPATVDNSTNPPPIPFLFMDVMKSRPELDPNTVYTNFCNHYTDEKRTLARWTKWVSTEYASVKATAASMAISVTVSGKPGIDPALAEILASDKLAVPMPPEVRRQLFQQKTASILEKANVEKQQRH